MILSQACTEIGRYPEIETIVNFDTPAYVTVNRFGGLVVTGTDQYERLAQSATYELGIVTAE